MRTFKTGDRVRVGRAEQSAVISRAPADAIIGASKDASIKATVTLASPNGASIVITFDGGFSLGTGGAYVGMMPLSRRDDGVFVDLILGQPVTVLPERIEESENEAKEGEG